MDNFIFCYRREKAGTFIYTDNVLGIQSMDAPALEMYTLLNIQPQIDLGRTK